MAVQSQSLYRKYRPSTFAELRGQDHVSAALRNALREDRVGHAYLFSGPRGTGKTTWLREKFAGAAWFNLLDEGLYQRLLDEAQDAPSRNARSNPPCTALRK